MSRRVIGIALVFLTVATVLGGVMLKSNVSPMESAQKFTQKVLDDCNTVPPEFVECSGKGLSRSVEQFGGLTAVEAYLSLVKLDDRYKKSCHDALHQMGLKMGTYLRENLALFAPYGSECGFSIIHEVAETVEVGTSAESAAQAIADLCAFFPIGDTAAEDACFHGAGHRLFAALGPDVARDACAQLKWQQPRKSCYYGVAMKKIDKLTADAAYKKIEPSNSGWAGYIDACGADDTALVEACMSLQSENVIFLPDDYKASFNKYCSDAYPELAWDCGLHFGVSISGTDSTVKSPAYYLPRCAESTGSEDFKRGCIAGIPSGLSSRGGTLRESVDLLCQSVSKEVCDDVNYSLRLALAAMENALKP